MLPGVNKSLIIHIWWFLEKGTRVKVNPMALLRAYLSWLYYTKPSHCWAFHGRVLSSVSPADLLVSLHVCCHSLVPLFFLLIWFTFLVPIHCVKTINGKYGLSYFQKVFFLSLSLYFPSFLYLNFQRKRTTHPWHRCYQKANTPNPC